MPQCSPLAPREETLLAPIVTTSLAPAAPLVSTRVSGPANAPMLETGGARHPLPFFGDFPPGARVLDVGCGSGEHLRLLAERGCQAVGIERDEQLVATLREEGFDVTVGTAEQLPFADRSLDGIVCSVVLPYADERRAVLEWGRVLAPGGQVRASYHGSGYAAGYLMGKSKWSKRVYALRMIANSWCYALTGRRLPGFLGDTLYQSRARLARYYRAAGLALVAEYIHPGPAGLPKFIYHALEKQ